MVSRVLPHPFKMPIEMTTAVGHKSQRIVICFHLNQSLLAMLYQFKFIAGQNIPQVPVAAGTGIEWHVNQAANGQ